MKRFTIFSLIVLCLTFLTSQLHAQIQEGRIGTGNFHSFDGNVYQEYGLDFNNDGEVEFTITDFGFDVVFEKSFISYSWSEIGSSIWTVGNMEIGNWDAVYNVPFNTAIGANSNWASEGDAMIIDMFTQTSWLPIGEDSYIGFRVLLNGNIHYGWAKVNVTGDATTGFHVEWLQCAYETTPNTPILAGNLNTSLIEETNTKIQVYPNPTIDKIYLSNLHTEFQNYQIFNNTGRLITKGQLNENFISLADLHIGVYILRLQNENKTSSIRIIKK